MVHFVGAGSGAVDLITVRGARLLAEADVVIYAGSLVNPEFLDYTSYSGRRTYCRSLTFLLFKAAKDLFPNRKVLMR